MILTETEIKERLTKREIVIEPLLDREGQIDSTSIDLRLDNVFGEFQYTTYGQVDLADKREEYVKTREIDFFSDPYYIHPGEFVLGQTFEYIILPENILGKLDGRSSLGRQGIVVHVTAGSVDPGFEGHLVLEFANLGKVPFSLYPLMRIGRITFEEISPTKKYVDRTDAKYKRQIEFRESLMLEDKDLQRILDIRNMKRSPK